MQQIDPVNKGNKKLYLLVKNTNRKTKHKQENKTKARCQVGNKAMTTKLTNMLREKKRMKGQISTVKQRQMKKMYTH